MAYSDLQKAIAKEVLERNGWVLTTGALKDIRMALNKPKLNSSTIYRWFPAQLQKIKNEETLLPDVTPYTLELQVKASKALDMQFEELAHKYLERAIAESAMAKMSGRDFVMAAAVAVDKMRLLRDLPTEIVVVLPPLIEAIKQAGMSPTDVFNVMMMELTNASARTGSQNTPSH